MDVSTSPRDHTDRQLQILIYFRKYHIKIFTHIFCNFVLYINIMNMISVIF